MNPIAGTVVADRYRLERPLGLGGMGAVWLAHHVSLRIPCAVKFIHAHAAELPAVRARFEREAVAAAQLRSPHVVQILDHGVWEEVPYIAMELLEGEDLQHRIARHRGLPPHEVLAIVTQVARALTKAHALGLVHRDLKPANVFLVRDDDREIAKILDFGIAKTDAYQTTDGSTKTGSLLGTPYYMSPEQAQGSRNVDHRSDLWALGVLTFECLTGLRPFAAEALGEVFMRIMVRPIPVPSQVASLPPGFDAWWEKAVSRDPETRFQTARELSDALGPALGIVTADPADLAARSSFVGRAPVPAAGPHTPAPLSRTPSGVAIGNTAPPAMVPTPAPAVAALPVRGPASSPALAPTPAPAHTPAPAMAHAPTPAPAHTPAPAMAHTPPPASGRTSLPAIAVAPAAAPAAAPAVATGGALGPQAGTPWPSAPSSPLAPPTPPVLSSPLQAPSALSGSFAPSMAVSPSGPSRAGVIATATVAGLMLGGAAFFAWGSSSRAPTAAAGDTSAAQAAPPVVEAHSTVEPAAPPPASAAAPVASTSASAARPAVTAEPFNDGAASGPKPRAPAEPTKAPPVAAGRPSPGPAARPAGAKPAGGRTRDPGF